MKIEKINKLLAIVRADCDKCHEEDWLYIPQDDYYGLLCESCMVEGNYEIDDQATRDNLGCLYP
uniref:Uncharacterized protein n=1 Tax=viral metagenome TaxID=1070528 RepID=A0A6H2A6Y3_9ZZZZ